MTTLADLYRARLGELNCTESFAAIIANSLRANDRNVVLVARWWDVDPALVRLVAAWVR